MKLSETISQGVLVCTSLYCRFNSELDRDPLDIVGIASTGLSAVLTIYRTHYPEDIPDSLVSITEFMQTLSYPCMVGYLWLKYGEERYIAYAHPLSMVVLKVLGTDALDLDPVLMTTLGYTLNEASCLYLSHIKQNVHAMAGTTVFLLMELGLLFKDEISLPPTEVSNYGMSAVLLLFTMAYKEAGKSV